MNGTGSCISVPVDLLNPGQFFACCGLFEIADRTWAGVQGRFSHDSFDVACPDGQATFPRLLKALSTAKVDQLDSEDKAEIGRASCRERV